MKINYLKIENYKSIRSLTIEDVENVLILVGKNNTGKTVVLDAIRVASGDLPVKESDYVDRTRPILISMKVAFDETDLMVYYNRGIISKHKNQELWKKEFNSKLPSYQDGVLSFVCTISVDGKIRYADGVKKNNSYIKKVFPKVFHLDQTRLVEDLQREIIKFYDKIGRAHV